MNHKLTVIAHIRAKAGQEARVQEALLGLIVPTHAEAGCINYDLHVSEEDLLSNRTQTGARVARQVTICPADGPPLC